MTARAPAEPPRQDCAPSHDTGPRIGKRFGRSAIPAAPPRLHILGPVKACTTCRSWRIDAGTSSAGTLSRHATETATTYATPAEARRAMDDDRVES